MTLANEETTAEEYTLYEESLAMFRELGNKRGMAVCLKQLAVWLFVGQGDQATLQARLEESLTLSRELGDRDGISIYFWIQDGEHLFKATRSLPMN